MPNTFPNDQLMVRYLLGESLAETEQSEFEALLFSGTDFVEQLQAMELELVARYERGELGAHERGLFEKRFLIPQERRDLLTFVRTLSSIVEEQSNASASASVAREKASNSESSWLPRWNLFVGWSKREPVRAAILVAAVIPLGAVVAVLDYPFLRDIEFGPATPTMVRLEPPNRESSLATLQWRRNGEGGGIGGGAFKVGGGVSEPVLLTQLQPEYSDDGRKARIQGTVELLIIVNTDGTVKFENVKKSLGYGLDQKAIEAVKKWKFAAGKKDGRAVPTYLSVLVNFSLQ